MTLLTASQSLLTHGVRSAVSKGRTRQCYKNSVGLILRVANTLQYADDNPALENVVQLIEDADYEYNHLLGNYLLSILSPFGLDEEKNWKLAHCGNDRPILENHKSHLGDRKDRHYSYYCRYSCLSDEY